ncbi:MAG TPA: hypothetical protein VK324_16355 [Tepidisphaeraceae bacterium]|nr:hypothetical protein [Tepidisphaeraceae bacterium]
MFMLTPPHEALMDSDRLTPTDRLRNLLLPGVVIVVLCTTWALAWSKSLESEASRGYYYPAAIPTMDERPSAEGEDATAALSDAF